MAGPILQGEHHVSWASHTNSSISHYTSTHSQQSTGPEMHGTFFSPSKYQLYNDSPLPMSPNPLQKGLADQSNPSSIVPADAQQLRPILPILLNQSDHHFKSDSSALLRAAGQESLPNVPLLDQGPLELVQKHNKLSHKPLMEPDLGVRKRKEKVTEDPDGIQDNGPVWGKSFKVEWVQTNHLPFYRTRQLRNPWNRDREVKVSRDGTELEPTIGQALLEEWDKPNPTAQQEFLKPSSQHAAPSQSTGRGRRR